MEKTPARAEESNARPWLRALAIVVPALAFIAVLAVALAGSGTPRPGDMAPDFSGPLLASEGSFSSEAFEGKPAVINFWASWCGPCKDEAPLLRDAFERYGDRIAFLGIDIRDSRTDALDFIDRYGLDYPHVRDENSTIYNDFGLTGQPETFFLGADGTIEEHVPGPLFADDLAVLLERLLTPDG